MQCTLKNATLSYLICYTSVTLLYAFYLTRTVCVRWTDYHLLVDMHIRVIVVYLHMYIHVYMYTDQLLST